MNFKFECPHCGQRIGTSLESVGVTAECPTCKQQLTIPVSPESIKTGSGSDQKRIWHPAGITLLGIPFGYVFASVLIGLNWHRLRRHGMAFFAYVFAVAYAAGVQWPLLPLFPWPWPYLLGALVWFPILGLPQWQYIRQRSASLNSKRPWLRVIGIGMAIQVTLAIWERHDQTVNGVPSVANAAAAVGSKQEYSPEELAEIAQNFIFEIQVTWKLRRQIVFQEDGGSAGSAVLVRAIPGTFYFVTNRHVVEPPPTASDYRCSLQPPGAPAPIPVDVVAFCKNGIDLALLRVVEPGSSDTFIVPMAPTMDVALGQACIAIGNALGSGNSVTTGVVSRFDDVGGIRFIRTSAPISHGNSGGGLFRLKDGALIGITTSTVLAGQNINLAIPVDYFARDDAWEYLQEGKR